MDAAAYRIADEPRPGGLAHLAVNPFWPFLALMLGGGWIAWPWFVVNAFAIGSATKVRELVLVVASALASLCLVFAVGVVFGAELIPRQAAPYAGILFPVVRLSFGYFLYIAQATSFELFQYYGGKARNGALLVVAAWFLEPRVLAPLPDLLRWVVA